MIEAAKRAKKAPEGVWMPASVRAVKKISGEPAGEIIGVERSGSPGEPASQTSHRKPQIMKTLADRIVDAQIEVVRQKDLLTAAVAADDCDDTVTDEISKLLEAAEGKLASLKRAETALATKTIAPDGAGATGGTGGTTVSGRSHVRNARQEVGP
ncbi:hypothetical protein [uncultured Sphingomonas sp.]|uniref:hypothetical protein n=1 Tax=uncultured Sphingomonas sp. TaxID=158754 RepID=UPI0035CAA2BB